MKLISTDLIKKVHFPRYPRIMNPLRMVFISGIPEPQAYGANVRTKLADSAAKMTATTTYEMYETAYSYGPVSIFAIPNTSDHESHQEQFPDIPVVTSSDDQQHCSSFR